MSVETVILPDRNIYVREIYERVRKLANGWPINFKTTPPAFHFMPGNFKLPQSLNEQLTAAPSENCKCQDAKVCMLLKKNTYEVVCQVEQTELNEPTRCIIDHPIMMLAAKVG